MPPSKYQTAPQTLCKRGRCALPVSAAGAAERRPAKRLDDAIVGQIVVAADGTAKTVPTPIPDRCSAAACSVLQGGAFYPSDPQKTTASTWASRSMISSHSIASLDRSKTPFHRAPMNTPLP